VCERRTKPKLATVNCKIFKYADTRKCPEIQPVIMIKLGEY